MKWPPEMFDLPFFPELLAMSVLAAPNKCPDSFKKSFGDAPRCSPKREIQMYARATFSCDFYLRDRESDAGLDFTAARTMNNVEIRGGEEEKRSIFRSRHLTRLSFPPSPSQQSRKQRLKTSTIWPPFTLRLSPIPISHLLPSC